MAKFSELICFVDRHKPEVILIAETWLKSDIPDSVCSIPGYDVYRSDGTINIGHDGVCAYLKHGVSDSFRINISHVTAPGIDNIFLALQSPNVEITIGCMYRPHASDSDAILLKYLSDMVRLRSNIFIAGDFNIPQLKWPLTSLPGGPGFHAAFAEVLSDSGISQLITEPTRFRDGQQPSTLDLVLVNEMDLVSDISYHPPLGRSDHVCIMSRIQFSLDRRAGRATNVDIPIVNYSSLSSALERVNWDRVLELDDIDAKWLSFVSTVNNLVASHTSVRTVKRCPLKPWITAEILVLIKAKNSLWQRFRRTGDRFIFLAHRRLSNHLSTVLKRARSSYVDDMVSSGDKKRFYKYIRSNISTKVSVPLLRDSSGAVCNDHQNVADIFASNFSAVFTREPSGRLPFLTTPRCMSTLCDIEFSPFLVESELRGLNASTSPGLDGLTAKLLKQCAYSLSGPLSLVLQASFTRRTLPQAWLDASITPIFKRGDKLDPGNYRPVSVVSIVAKVAERIILKKMLPFLLENSVIPKEQHGFIPGRSVVTNLLTCLNDWTNSVDRKIPVDVIYLDFSRAFDRVPKRRLLYKLEHAGIRGDLLEWIDSFLSNRSFVVRAGTTFSSRQSVISGVPQGSVLGPILFLVYISDLPSLLKSKCSLYADDMKLYGNPLSDHATLQRDLSAVQDWCGRWLLPLNVTKCTVLHIAKTNPHLHYKLGSAMVKAVTSQSDLGVVITSDLTWSEHILSVTSKASRFLYMARKAFQGCSPRTAAKLYTTYARPILEFAGPVWNPDLVRDLNLLETVQRRFTRLSYGLVRPTYEERLIIMNLPTFQQRRHRGDLIITYRALHSCFESDLSHMFPLNINNLRGHQLKLKKQEFSTRVRQNFLCNRVFSSWNSLPAEVVGAVSVNSFKNRFDELQGSPR